MTIPISDRTLMSALMVGHQELSRLLEARLEGTGLTALEAVVLRTAFWNRNPTVGAIRATLALPASTSTQVVDRLCVKGLTRRETAQDDRRLAIVRLTSLGKQVAGIVVETARAIDTEVRSTAGTDASDVTRVADAIELLAWRERRARLRHW
jgi:DNA-binding MarR family transcriptional regulator